MLMTDAVKELIKSLRKLEEEGPSIDLAPLLAERTKKQRKLEEEGASPAQLAEGLASLSVDQRIVLLRAINELVLQMLEMASVINERVHSKSDVIGSVGLLTDLDNTIEKIKKHLLLPKASFNISFSAIVRQIEETMKGTIEKLEILSDFPVNSSRALELTLALKNYEINTGIDEQAIFSQFAGSVLLRNSTPETVAKIVAANAKVRATLGNKLETAIERYFTEWVTNQENELTKALQALSRNVQNALANSNSDDDFAKFRKVSAALAEIRNKEYPALKKLTQRFKQQKPGFENAFRLHQGSIETVKIIPAQESKGEEPKASSSLNSKQKAQAEDPKTMVRFKSGHQVEVKHKKGDQITIVDEIQNYNLRLSTHHPRFLELVKTYEETEKQADKFYEMLLTAKTTLEKNLSSVSAQAAREIHQLNEQSLQAAAEQKELQAKGIKTNLIAKKPQEPKDAFYKTKERFQEQLGDYQIQINTYNQQLRLQQLMQLQKDIPNKIAANKSKIENSFLGKVQLLEKQLADSTQALAPLQVEITALTIDPSAKLPPEIMGHAVAAALVDLQEKKLALEELKKQLPEYETLTREFQLKKANLAALDAGVEVLEKQIGTLTTLLNLDPGAHPNIQIYVDIKALLDYGEELKLEDRAKGEAAIEVALLLTLKANSYIAQPELYPDDASQEAYRKDFLRILHSQDEMMAEHRGYKTLLGNIALALTGFGLLLIAGRLAYSALTNDTPRFFFSSTHRQNLVAQVESTFNVALIPLPAA